MTHATISDCKSSSSSPSKHSSDSDADGQRTGIPKHHTTECDPQRGVFCFEIEDEQDDDDTEDINEIAPQTKRARPEEECANSQGEVVL